MPGNVLLIPPVTGRRWTDSSHLENTDHSEDGTVTPSLAPQQQDDRHQRTQKVLGLGLWDREVHSTFQERANGLKSILPPFVVPGGRKVIIKLPSGKEKQNKLLFEIGSNHSVYCSKKNKQIKEWHLELPRINAREPEFERGRCLAA